MASWKMNMWDGMCFFFNFNLLFIQVSLNYNVVLITAVQQSDPIKYIYILFHVLFHCGLSQDIEYSSRCGLVFSQSLFHCHWETKPEMGEGGVNGSPECSFQSHCPLSLQ